MGNGGQWMNAPGYQTTHVPTEHSALSFSPGQADADPTYGHIAFVEVKAPNQKPRPLQLSRHRLLRRLGFRVYVLDALEDIDKIIKEVMSNETS